MTDRPYFYGELVRLRMHPQCVGQVVGEEDWGRRYVVRIHGEYEPRLFDDCELLPVIPEAAAAVQSDDSADVIDFTKERKLRKTTTTRGAA